MGEVLRKSETEDNELIHMTTLEQTYSGLISLERIMSTYRSSLMLRTY